MLNVISYFSLPGESSTSTFWIIFKKSPVDNASKPFNMRPRPGDKGILLHSTTKVCKDHQIPQIIITIQLSDFQILKNCIKP